MSKGTNFESLGGSGGGVSKAEVETIANEAEEDAKEASLPRSTFAYHGEDANGNMAIGSSLPVLSTGKFNIAIGVEVQIAQTNGTSNNAIGYKAQHSVSEGSFNNCIGRESQFTISSGENNNVIGDASQNSLTTGHDNNGVGDAVQRYCSMGSHNNVLGGRAQYQLTAASYNVALGGESQYNLTSSIATFGTITGGSGYKNGTYNNVPLTKIAGPSLRATPTANITVEGGTVTNLALVNAGGGIDTTTVLSASATKLGGTGSGFSVPVATIVAAEGNVAIGHESGYSSKVGIGCVFIGYQSGKQELSSNKLYISNSETSEPLIKGDFSAKELQFYTNKIGFFGSSPIEKPHVGAASGGVLAEDTTLVNSIREALINLGLAQT